MTGTLDKSLHRLLTGKTEFKHLPTSLVRGESSELYIIHKVLLWLLLEAVLTHKHPTKTLPVLNVFAGPHVSPLPWGFFCSESLMMLLSGGLTTASGESQVQEASKPAGPKRAWPRPLSVILQCKPHPYSCQPPSPTAKLAPA